MYPRRGLNDHKRSRDRGLGKDLTGDIIGQLDKLLRYAKNRLVGRQYQCPSAWDMHTEIAVIGITISHVHRRRRGQRRKEEVVSEPKIDRIGVKSIEIKRGYDEALLVGYI